MLNNGLPCTSFSEVIKGFDGGHLFGLAFLLVEFTHSVAGFQLGKLDSTVFVFDRNSGGISGGLRLSPQVLALAEIYSFDLGNTLLKNPCTCVGLH
ncbi:hypothetical protein AOLI_G00294510 [Acnodon oligacanthus]